jgi:hypothetical protein
MTRLTHAPQPVAPDTIDSEVRSAAGAHGVV